MKESKPLVLKLIRFVVVMILCTLVTSILLMIAVPGIGKWVTIIGSVCASLVIALFDLGIFRGDFEL